MMFSVVLNLRCEQVPRVGAWILLCLANGVVRLEVSWVTVLEVFARELARDAARWSMLLKERPHEGMGARNPDEGDLDATACLGSADEEKNPGPHITNNNVMS